MIVKTPSNKKALVMSLPYTILAIIALCMLLTGCDLSEPTKVSQNRIQVEEELFTDTVSVADFNEAAVNGLAQHYRKHGDGPVNLTVTYDPKAVSGGAMKASETASSLSKDLRDAGVQNVVSGILPVMQSGNDMNVMVSYTAYNALAPKDCTTMAGFEGSEVNVEEEYKLGCTVDTVFARQIARPKDLRGQSSSDPITDGRRSANTIETYRTGIPNEPLGGESATE